LTHKPLKGFMKLKLISSISIVVGLLLGVTGEFGKNSTLRVLNAITLHNIQDCVFA
jgi:cell division protein FtsB